MISIESITAEWEDNSLWGTVIIYSDTDQTAFTDTVITLTGDREYTDILQEKLIAGKNELEFMFSPNPLLWFPNGCGQSYVYELSAEAYFGEEYSDYKTFIGLCNIKYQNSQLEINGFYPQIFGLSLNMVTLRQIDFAKKCGFNCIFSGDRRKEISDWCTIKGIVLLPYEKPTCTPDNAEIFRKTDKPVIFSFKDTEDEKLIKKITSPLYIGTDFISNNTNEYISGTLSQGYIDPVSNNIDIISETDITVGEFQTIPFTDYTEPQDGRISFVNLWHNSNISAKKIHIGKNTEFGKTSVLVSRFQTNENTWEILFSSNEYIPNLSIITENEISCNNFDIFPGETVKVTFTNISGEPDFQLKTV